LDKPVTPAPAPAGATAAGMRSVLDPRDPAARRVPAGAITPSALPPVAAVVIDPDVTVAQLLNHASGPLPLTAEMATHAGTLLLFVSGTGRVAGFEPGYGYPLGVSVKVDGQHAGQATVLALSQERHTFSNLIVVNGLEWGRHTLTLESFKEVMTTDGTDLFNVTAIEI
jgi:hypothetical protein